MMPAVYEVLDTLCQGLKGLMGGVFSTKPAVQMSRARSRESQRMFLDHYRGQANRPGQICLFCCEFYHFSVEAAFTATATQAGFPRGSARIVRSLGATTAAQTNMDIDRGMKAASWQWLSTPAETRLQAAVSPATDWHYVCYQLVCVYFLLLL